MMAYWDDHPGGHRRRCARKLGDLAYRVAELIKLMPQLYVLAKGNCNLADIDAVVQSFSLTDD